jgi:hypothetical protein
MATVQGIREKVHLPIYDSLKIEPEEQLREVESSSTLKFFVNVQGKTKLETNLQSASLLPHYNTYEARALRVVISDLPPEFSADPVSKGTDSEGFDVTDADGHPIDKSGNVGPGGTFVPADAVTADLELDLQRLMELIVDARDDANQETTIDIDEEGVSLIANDNPFTPTAAFEKAGPVIILSVADIEQLIQTMDKQAPPLEQIRSNDGAGNIISKLIYSTVTTFLVGEKIMIEAPTWLFPSGAGPYSLSTKSISHGEPSPMATFRFAEPIFIDKQQNFRVEVEVPDGDVLREVQKIYGPLFIWVVLDGYMTRDVQ